jgi:hypothetical protein
MVLSAEIRQERSDENCMQSEWQPIITCQNAYFNSGKYPITAVGIWKKENDLFQRSAYFRSEPKRSRKPLVAQWFDDCIHGISQKGGSQKCW